MDKELNLPGNRTEDENEGSSQHVVSMKWLDLVEEKIKKNPDLLTISAGKASCCIFRVPKSLVNINKEAYEPNIVSIGPYHHGKNHLMMLQQHKWRYLGSLLSLTQKDGIGFKHFFEAIAAKEKEIRECYSETIPYASRDLIEMMVLDGCFILELLCIVGLGRLVNPDPDDPIFSLTWMLRFLMRDLLKLENQIPFFVLETLFRLSMPSIKKNVKTLTELVLEFFNYAVNRPEKVIKSCKKIGGRHLLDLFLLTFIPPTPTEEHPKETSDDMEEHPKEPRMIKCAMKLRHKGIKFKQRQDGYSFLDIKLSESGVLEIPTLVVDDFITSFLLNSVAFEQSYSHRSKYMTDYISFMGCLMDTPTDAGYLNDKQIIENYFGTHEEVTQFVHKVGKDVHFDIWNSYLLNVFNGVNKYCEASRHVRWADFKHTYFDSPWSCMSAGAGLLILIVTLFQAYFAAYAYFRPPKQN